MMLIKRALVFIAVGIILVIVTYQYSNIVIRWLSPLYQCSIQQFEYRFNDIQLTIQQVKGTDYLVIRASLPQTFFANGQMLKTTQTIRNIGGIPIGNVMHPLVIIFTLLLAWPANVWKVYLYRLSLMTPAILIITLTDIPIQLIHISWQGFDKTLNLSVANTSWYGPWSDFLNGGGLIAISIAIGLAIIGFVEARVIKSIRTSYSENNQQTQI